MRPNEWGPIPKLAEQLARSEAYPSNWASVVIREGGLWEAAMMSQGASFWPSDLLPAPRAAPARPPAPAPPPAQRGGFLAMLLRFFARLFEFRKPDGPEPLPVRPAARRVRAESEGDVFTTLADCYEWLGSLSLRGLTPYFAPFWRELPYPVLVGSPYGVVSSLSAYSLQAWGPGGVEGLKKVLASGISGATVGDCVAFHLQLESLAVAIRKGRRLPPFPASARRRVGGLRSEAFVASYLALVNEADDREVAGWLDGLDALIEFSPLTRVAYLDILRRPADIFRRDEEGFLPPLLKVAGAPEDGTDDKGWRELWASHLARSLLGACLSPPPSFEPWRLAEEKLGRLTGARQTRRPPGDSGGGAARRLELADGALKPKERAEDVEKRSRELRERMRQEYLSRWETVTAWLAGSEYLKLRFLDLLVRQISAECAPRMSAVWPKIKREAAWQVAREYFFWKIDDRPESGVCFDAFEDTLFGARSETDRTPVPPPPDDERHRRVLQGLLPVNSPTASDISRDAGVFEGAARRLLTRFQTVGVVIPVPEERGYAPEQLLAEWVTTLLARLPGGRTTNVRATVVGQGG